MITTAFAMNGAKVYITGRRLEVLEKTSKEINEMVNGKGSVVPYVIIDRTTSVLLLNSKLVLASQTAYRVMSAPKRPSRSSATR
jgi:NADP-dependent 3-hydroxy acid dehydrogenase YdfG